MNEPYRGEWDARTLAEAEQIKSDPGRLEKAKAAAKQMVKQQNEEAKAMRKVADGSSQKPSANTQSDPISAGPVPAKGSRSQAMKQGLISNYGPGVTKII